jgi:hypothetical protein
VLLLDDGPGAPHILRTLFTKEARARERHVAESVCA